MVTEVVVVPCSACFLRPNHVFRVLDPKSYSWQRRTSRTGPSVLYLVGLLHVPRCLLVVYVHIQGTVVSPVPSEI
jgi:hypothetical protein